MCYLVQLFVSWLRQYKSFILWSLCRPPNKYKWLLLSNLATAWAARGSGISPYKLQDTNTSAGIEYDFTINIIEKLLFSFAYQSVF